jgi:hypothetical protein
MSAVPAWCQLPEVQSLLSRMVDRLDAAELRGSGRAQSVALNERVWPELFNATYESDKEALWGHARQLHSLGWVKLMPDSAARSSSGYDQDVRLSILIPQALREATGRFERTKSAGERWREAVEQHLEATSVAKRLVGGYCIDLPGRGMAEVVQRLNGLREMGPHPLLLREVSARLFWGMSKVLDGRQALVAAILGREDCPFPESPVQLLVQLPNGPVQSVLFIENQMSFEQACRSNSRELEGMALVFASGFRGSAQRLRSISGASIYFSSRSSIEASPKSAFEDWLFSGSDSLPVLFWGDLDWAGMGILRALRLSFPGARAWEVGFAPMLRSLLAGNGHDPDSADKQGQLSLSATGCEYADTWLLPAISEHGQFVDQELFVL